MVKRLLLLCLLYSILYLPILHAQTPPFTPLYRKQIVPLSPMAAALGKYVDIPVSLATGTPEISIPLYEVRGRELSLPISLSYHAGGFKVNELASWVGLGWSLNAGGMVGRTIRGMVDDGASYMKHFGNRSFPLSQEGDYNLLSYLSENTLDGQPDLYFFNFSGFNGKFIQTDDVYLMPKQPLRVVGDVLNGWEITAPNGDRYSFKEKETTLVRGDNLAEGNVTSWLLSEIVSANGTETIYFEYKGVTHREGVTLSETKVYDGSIADASPQLKYSDINGTLTTIYGKQLARIRFPQGRIEFISETVREDLRPRDNLDPNQPVRLDAIKVYDIQDNIIKHFVFEYDYFKVGNSPEDKRLKLTGLAELPTGALSISQDMKSHSFSYNETQKLPQRNSYSQDHWGYFNNKGYNNGTLIPQFRFPDGMAVSGANRETDTTAVKANLLTRITYPTGGYAEYEYQAHDYSFVQDRLVDEVLVNPIPHSYSAEAWNRDLSKVPEEQPYNVSEIFYIDTEQVVDIYPNVYTQTAGTDTQLRTYAVNGYLGARVQIIGENGFQKTYHASDNSNQTLKLLPGKYRVEATATDVSSYASITLIYRTFSSTPVRLKPAGGVRVRKTRLHDGVDSENDIVKVYKYRLNANSKLSSGTLNTEPIYNYQYLNWELPWEHNGGGTSGDDNGLRCSSLLYHYQAYTSRALNFTGESTPINYSEVTVTHGQNGEIGSSDYFFTSHYDYPDGDTGGEMYPFSPPTDKSWQRGLLLRQIDFDRFKQKKREVINVYAADSLNRDIFTGYKAVYYYKHPCGPSYVYDPELSDLNHRFSQETYQMISEFQYLASTTEREYDLDNPSVAVSSQTTYYYDRLPKHTLLTRTEQQNSNGSYLVTRMKYPTDYTFPDGVPLAPEAEAMKAMVERHMIIQVVEKTVWEKTATDTALIRGELTKFAIFTPAGKILVLPQKLYFLELAAPIPSAFYEESSIGAKNGIHSLLHDQHFTLRTSLVSYDNFGNLTELIDSDQRRFVYLWGYRNQLPVAEIENATLAQVEGALGGTASLKALSSSTVLSPQQIEELIALRSRLPEARVNSYTYRSLFGLSSVTDANGRTSSYEYDGLGRLRLVRDHEGNVLKAYEYHYKN